MSKTRKVKKGRCVPRDTGLIAGEGERFVPTGGELARYGDSFVGEGQDKEEEDEAEDLDEVVELVPFPPEEDPEG